MNVNRGVGMDQIKKELQKEYEEKRFEQLNVLKFLGKVNYMEMLKK